MPTPHKFAARIAFNDTQDDIKDRELEQRDADHDLMGRVALGDMRAYRELMGKHLNRSVKVAERMLGNRQDAEDVMQEACLKIWVEAPRWQPRAKFSTWLYRIVLNACLDRRRKNGTTTAHMAAAPADEDWADHIADDAPLAEDRLIEAQQAAQVQKALQDLPDRQRAAIVLSYYENMSNQDSADAMGIRLGAFQQLLFRAKQSLKTSLISETSL